MGNVYQDFPLLENQRFLLRQVGEKDAQELVEVYGDKNALPFFNSDNCNGDNFYYPTRERMAEAIRFWLRGYEKGWFVRWAVVEKGTGRAIGTAELCRRDSQEGFGGCGILRLDVKNSCERAETLLHLLRLTLPCAFERMGCGEVATKAPLYAVERREALAKAGFVEDARPLIGEGGRSYWDYWVIARP